MFLYKVPDIVNWFYPDYIWHKERTSSRIYLTFDDGPVPGATDFVLEELGKRGMKATFFMVGENVSRHPDLAREVRKEGHRIGNHTQHHLNGAKTTTKDYLRDTYDCQETLIDIVGVNPMIFRPPYGRLRTPQKKALLSKYDIVFWDVLAGDFRKGLLPAKSLRKIMQKTQNGSVILFHDQTKTSPFIRKMLPDFLDYIASSGYQTGLL
ncbi:polysaccharide deacetylase family protein [Negadavirga shengliensis]|uniref:Polysaccharide deacetylase family protein n=1 Tax=Negadavirga shengliensis TaxID=1389218 RepID=A0ABV9T2W9_9BACT